MQAPECTLRNAGSGDKSSIAPGQRRGASFFSLLFGLLSGPYPASVGGHVGSFVRDARYFRSRMALTILRQPALVGEAALVGLSGVRILLVASWAFAGLDGLGIDPRSRDRAKKARQAERLAI